MHLPRPRFFALRTTSASPATEESASLREFEVFHSRHEARILGYLWRMVGDEQAARDLTQDVFVRAWQNFGTLAGYDRPDAWLFRVATNLALNHLRQAQRQARHLAQPAQAETKTISDPSEQIAERDLVLHSLRMVSPRERAALVLHGVYGLTCAELASTLHISVSAAKVALWRGR